MTSTGMSRVAGALVALATAVSSRPVTAQDETLLRGGTGAIGYYVAPVVGVTEVGGRGEALGGLRAGILFGRRFAVGLAGSRSRNYAPDYIVVPVLEYASRLPSSYAPPPPYNEHVRGLSYGGLELEYLWEPSKLVHATVSTLIGGGSIGTAYRYAYVATPADPCYPGYCGGGYGYAADETFFVTEPAAHVEVNVAQHVRLSLGLGYRFTAGGDRYGTGADRTRGATGSLAVKIGKL